ncbi:hypothetical protein BpJC7_02080 [Weizmannia acidilactici]|uniref:FAS1-like dehydratase domain-containing protein n=1 Tax=Weizmannia acidilactici TaxID=2607726 RepID=A0A5J4JEC0_9BACI|nr:MaoC family dehydratase N-terminal domain-containing protein [Weizmannia acidilactici]GER66634.1 hypothetical protein BpJC4_11050 [Weizmannia acidilactici]GER68905.1 hypothetical protein BpJC7_02080 [Weizmannia acidilactici]GER73533.1 hypothetical protein BpPP18_16000 [Weizmannia acidilactici]
MFEELIGKRSSTVWNTIERGAVKKFADAIGDPHPIYIDPVFAANAGLKNNVAPPTFPVTFDYGTIEGLELPKAGLIHGEQGFEYKRPLYVGEELLCWSVLEKYQERKGKLGEMGFLFIKKVAEDESGEIVMTSTQIIIISETVRKGMKA